MTGSLRGVVHLLGVMALAYALVSLSWSQGDSLLSAGWLLSLAGAFALGSWVRDTRLVWTGYIWLTVAFVCIHAFAALWVGETIAQNYRGMLIALAIAGVVAYREWFALPVLLIGLYDSQSRGAIMAVGFVLLVGLFRRFPVTAILSAGCAFVGIILLGYEKSWGGGDVTRLGVWQDVINHMTIWGAGYGGFLETYKAFSIHTNVFVSMPPHVYNDFLELTFELGIGAMLFWVMAIITLAETSGPERLICWAFIIMGLTFFPLSLFPQAQLFLFGLGHLSRRGSLASVRRGDGSAPLGLQRSHLIRSTV